MSYPERLWSETAPGLDCLARKHIWVSHRQEGAFRTANGETPRARRGACGAAAGFRTRTWELTVSDETEYRVARRPRGDADAEWRVTRDQSPYWDPRFEYRVQVRRGTSEWRSAGERARGA